MIEPPDVQWIVRVAILVLVSSLAAGAHSSPAQQPEPPRTVAWRLEITTSGGLTGRGSGSVSIASDGTLTCSPAAAMRCPQSLEAARLRELDREIRSAPHSGWSAPERGICSDCIITSVRLSRETADGAVQTVITSWDPTTRGRAPRDAVRIHDLAWGVQPVIMTPR